MTLHEQFRKERKQGKPKLEDYTPGRQVLYLMDYSEWLENKYENSEDDYRYRLDETIRLKKGLKWFADKLIYTNKNKSGTLEPVDLNGQKVKDILNGIKE